jgi:hypothetical protein
MNIKEKMITIKISERNLKWIKENYPESKQGVICLFEYGGIDIKNVHAISDILYHINEALKIEDQSQ